MGSRSGCCSGGQIRRVVKHQYFGDRHDFYKYDLLLYLMGPEAGLGFTQLVFGAMITPDDGSTDGMFTTYPPERRDQDLCAWLQQRVHVGIRDVGLLASYPSVVEAGWTYAPMLEEVPCAANERRAYFDAMLARLSPATLLFLDLDNGLMTKSATLSQRPKFVDWHEVTALFHALDEESVLLIFQHSRRVKRAVLWPMLATELRDRCGIEHVSVIAPDGLVAYYIIAKSAARHRQIDAALEPYVLRNRFSWPEPKSQHVLLE